MDGRRLHVEVLRPFGLYLLAIPLVSPQSEVHHLAFMLPAAAIVAARWGSGPSGIAAVVAGALLPDRDGRAAPERSAILRGADRSGCRVDEDEVECARRGPASASAARRLRRDKNAGRHPG